MIERTQRDPRPSIGTRIPLSKKQNLSAFSPVRLVSDLNRTLFVYMYYIKIFAVLL